MKKFIKTALILTACIGLAFWAGDALAGAAAGGAGGGGTESFFTIAGTKMIAAFKSVRTLIFIIGAFALTGLAFGAILGKVKWAWVGTLAFGLAILAVAGGIINYAADRNPGTSFEYNSISTEVTSSDMWK